MTMILQNTPEAEKELFKLLIPENATHGIEIGVLNGETSRFFLSTFPDLDLIGIDPIIPDSMEASLIGSEETITKNTEEFRDRFKFIHDFSYMVSHQFQDHYDFVFIDGSHYYEDVKQDYNMYRYKVKPGGILFFHDARMYRGGANFHPGPSKLVNELEASGEIEIIGEAFSLVACKVKKI